jgi:hypothetical protein
VTEERASGRQRRANPATSNVVAASAGDAAASAMAAVPAAPPRRAGTRRTAQVPKAVEATPQHPEIAHSGAATVAQAPRGAGIRVETLLYLLILVTAALTRFWDLGQKALHHDESLHAYYSWEFATGIGYSYENALMHGPFLFHGTALIYLLFGDSDASTRYLPALFGVVLVGLPYLLRSARLLGQWGALASSFFILVSPVLLYQSRYLRHDIFTLVGTMLLVVCILRHWERPQRRWIVIGGGTIAFLLTNHEIVFALSTRGCSWLARGPGGRAAPIWSWRYWAGTRPPSSPSQGNGSSCPRVTRTGFSPSPGRILTARPSSTITGIWSETRSFLECLPLWFFSSPDSSSSYAWRPIRSGAQTGGSRGSSAIPNRSPSTPGGGISWPIGPVWP